jgi:hypothetical protein
VKKTPSHSEKNNNQFLSGKRGIIMTGKGHFKANAGGPKKSKNLKVW